MRAPDGLIDGGRAVAPLLLGVIPFGLVFGVLAAESVLGPGLGYATSLLIFGGAAQFATVQLLDTGTLPAVVVATVLVLNSRHLMYSATMAPHFGEFPTWARYALPYLLTDEAFAVTIVRYQQVTDPAYERWFFTGAGGTLWASWQAATLAGVLLGAQLPGSLSLDFTIPLVFIALLVLTVDSRPSLVAALAAAVVAVAAASVPYGLGLIIATVAGVAGGVVAHRVGR